MAANISSGAIATLASLFIVAPVPHGPTIGTPQQVILSPAPGSPAKPVFPAPRLRTLELPITQPFLGFQGTLDSVTIADMSEKPAAPLASARTAVPELPELTPSADPTGLFAETDVPQPAAPATQFSVSSVEEFPGAVPVSVPRLAANPKWRRVLDETPQDLRGVECTGGGSGEQCASSPWGRWHELVRKVSALEGEERLQAVNEGINALLTYATDDDIYGVGDYWATVEESMARGRGDCEDIAIAKMWLLNAAGVDLSGMRLVVLKDTLRNLDHAVLSVVENGHQYVLDNTAWKVGRADWMRGYRPIYALSSEQGWIYGMRVPSAPPLQVAQSTVPRSPQ
jgi:predicted transglutaminase-like cysteine proteinase